MKFHTQVIRRTKLFHTQVKKTSFPAQNFLPMNELSHPSTNFHSQVRNFIPGREISHPGTEIHTQMQDFVLGQENEKPTSAPVERFDNFLQGCPGWGAIPQSFLHFRLFSKSC
jgi:hypothetical protein